MKARNHFSQVVDKGGSISYPEMPHFHKTLTISDAFASEPKMDAKQTFVPTNQDDLN